MRRGRLFIISSVAMLLLPAVPFIVTWREFRQARANRSLVVAIRKGNAASMAALLQQAADPNARDVADQPLI